MEELNTEIQTDNKIYIHIGWDDIAISLLGWIWEFTSMPFRWGKTQIENMIVQEKARTRTTQN